ncbi:MAG: serine hydrolase domain-containing protein [SAR202 cluster bacterium]|jgi:CubicO group peptidase (beta-lactamase class C family)|nr:serine hydrolase domain-containing protein [SAR202 cluster bacterium]MDP6513685.1 serine hydrolase domain-containing protein [SAR202 cluster bacterium]
MANLTTVVGSPENVGISSERLLRIDSSLQRYIDQEKLAGIVALIAREEQVCYFERFGQMSRETGMPMQLETIFRIYSMTKPITSVAAMMLWEEGRFQLDDPVSRYIPSLGKMKVHQESGNGSGSSLVDPNRPMTIRDLLTHTAGLTYGMWLKDVSAVDRMYDDANLLNRGHTLEEMVEKLSELPLVFHPGTRWCYSVATDVVARLIEVISGMAFDEYLQQMIFGPLAMPDTGFHVPEEKIERLATTYSPTMSTGLKAIDTPADSFGRPPRFLGGGGGLVSTAPDYLRFAQMMLNKGELDGVRFLGRKTVELMTTNHLTPELLPYSISPSMSGFTKGYGFGLGFAVMQDVTRATAMASNGEFNWGGAANTYFWVDPQEHLIGILLTQFMPMAHYNIDREFRVLAYQALAD